MAWFLRKSFRLGPLRLNLSKSGLGVSADVGTVRPMIAAIYARKSTAQGREADGHPPHDHNGDGAPLARVGIPGECRNDRPGLAGLLQRQVEHGAR